MRPISAAFAPGTFSLWAGNAFPKQPRQLQSPLAVRHGLPLEQGGRQGLKENLVLIGFRAVVMVEQFWRDQEDLEHHANRD